MINAKHALERPGRPRHLMTPFRVVDRPLGNNHRTPRSQFSRPGKPPACTNPSHPPNPYLKTAVRFGAASPSSITATVVSSIRSAHFAAPLCIAAGLLDS